MFFVTAETREQRLNTCRSCEHYKSSTGSCGTLVRGETVKKGKKTVKLCGCVMRLKSGLKAAECPVGKWHSEMNKKDLKAAKKWIQHRAGRDSLSKVEVEQLLEMHSKAFGHTEMTNCKPCLRQYIRNLENWVDQSENWTTGGDQEKGMFF
jgi:hypothetical protein